MSLDISTLYLVAAMVAAMLGAMLLLFGKQESIPEFAALLPCSMEEGVIAAERVREVFASSGIIDETGPVDTTVSIGIAGGPAGTELEVLLAAADTALYQAKRGGRNRVETAQEAPLSLENWRKKTVGVVRSLQPQTGTAPGLV